MRVIRFFAVIAISLLLAACAQTRTITVTEYRDRVVTDTVTLVDIRVDSTYLSHYEKQRGDTILVRVLAQLASNSDIAITAKNRITRIAPRIRF